MGCADVMYGIQQLNARKNNKESENTFFTVFPPFKTKLSYSPFEGMACLLLLKSAVPVLTIVDRQRDVGVPLRR